MTIAPGTRLGPYEITAKLGEGGMGEVYRATDSKLKREVAIKVLPAAFADDKERLARFEREAQVLAQLHHPNIASIFGLEESGGTKALVMELVEGEDLSQRIARGAVPVDEALAIARQIAEALEAAHERGIVHRDLKPANVKVQADGTVKVLDFGLAKAMDAGSAPGSQPDMARSPTLMHSPTLTALHGTQLGVILGTAAYMAPEQARGAVVDKRADVWAFGVVLYEMLTARQLFDGETVSDVLAAVLTREPTWSALPAATPPAVRRVLRRCLERNPKQRLRDIADARLDLAADTEAAAISSSPSRGERGRAFWAGWALAIVALLLAGLLAGTLMRRGARLEPGSEQVLRFQFVPSSGERLAYDVWVRMFAVSPDGTKVVYAIDKAPTTELRVRSLETSTSSAIPGTEGASFPFFSPDGKWVGFVAGHKLKKVALAGGAPTTLADAPTFRGADWGEDGAIYFAPVIYHPIVRVAASGGDPQPITKIRAEQGELQHRWPELLPGGKVLLYAIGSGGDWDEATIVAERLDTGERKILVKGGTFPRYLSSGHLVFARSRSLYALPFDVETLTTSGQPTEIVRDVAMHATGGADMDLSRTGLLMTLPNESVVGTSILSWLDRQGRGEPLKVPAQAYSNVGLSPQGDRAVLSIGNGISVLDFARVSLNKLTLSARAENPVWSRDGRRIYFAYEKDKTYEVFAKAADDSGAPERLFASEFLTDPYAVTRDGSRILAIRNSASAVSSLLLLDLNRPREAPKVLLESPFLDEVSASFSPDGRWAAYQSEESGRPEIYVRPTSGEDRKWQISVDGGTNPVWSPVGDEILFLRGRQFVAAPVSTKGAELAAGAPRVLFEGHAILGFDVSSDGKRFLVAEDPNPAAQVSLDAVVHWFTEVKRKVDEARTP